MCQQFREATLEELGLTDKNDSIRVAIDSSSVVTEKRRSRWSEYNRRGQDGGKCKFVV
jgi:hypothetical protein